MLPASSENNWGSPSEIAVLQFFFLNIFFHFILCGWCLDCMYVCIYVCLACSANRGQKRNWTYRQLRVICHVDAGKCKWVFSEVNQCS